MKWNQSLITSQSAPRHNISNPPTATRSRHLSSVARHSRFISRRLLLVLVSHVPLGSFACSLCECMTHMHGGHGGLQSPFSIGNAPPSYTPFAKVRRGRRCAARLLASRHSGFTRMSINHSAMGMQSSGLITAACPCLCVFVGRGLCSSVHSAGLPKCPCVARGILPSGPGLWQTVSRDPPDPPGIPLVVYRY